MCEVCVSGDGLQWQCSLTPWHQMSIRLHGFEFCFRR